MTTKLPRATPEGTVKEDGGAWVAAHVGPSGFRTAIRARAHDLVADEPVADGGTDTGPTPYEYLLGALSSCMAMTLRMYADRKGWPLEGVDVRMRTSRSHEPDCERCDTHTVGITRIERQVELSGPLTDEQRHRLLHIAEHCPVKQTLARAIQVVTVP